VSFQTLLYDTDGPIATITLNRPDQLNTILPPMPDEFDAAVREATLDRQVKVIVLRGAGRAFCAGYDFGGGFHHWETPYSRIWGCYLSGMWVYRLGLTKAKEHALTGKPLSDRQAADIELINTAVPFDQLETEVARQAEHLASIPMSQLAAMKLIVNQAYEHMGLHSTQTLGPILDGLMRNTPDAHAFIDKATKEGIKPPPTSATRSSTTTAWQAPAADPTRVTSSSWTDRPTVLHGSDHANEPSAVSLRRFGRKLQCCSAGEER
jgi:enoyl-CoA hydratase/carnithine racemase